MKRFIFALFVLALVGIALRQPTVSATGGSEAQISISPAMMMADEMEITDAYSVLVRNEDEISMMFHTAELAPGDAVTVWWVIFNNPAACADSPCTSSDLPQNDGNPEAQAAMIYADGGVIGDDGRASFTARLDVGDNENAYAFETDGLTDLENAEVHLVIRTHGEALEDMLAAQITTLNGGCDNGSETTGEAGPNTCANVMASIHIASQ